MEVLAAVHGRTAKGLTQVYQSFFRLEQLVMGVVTPKFILCILCLKTLNIFNII